MEYTMHVDVGIALLLSFSTFILLSVVILVLVRFGYFRDKSININQDKVIVFITAHPDDECMFFGPALLQITKQNTKNVHILCLTTGNFYNQGLMRKDELYESCKVLGIPATNVDILDNNSFLDGSWNWDFRVLLPELIKYTKRVKPDYIFTFDQYGVSRHTNHIDTSTAVRLLYRKFPSEEKTPTIFELESVTIYRKYISFLDALISVMSSHCLFTSSLSDILKVQTAMYAHKSQLVWFRRFYIIFSRYVAINTFKEIAIDSSSKCS